MLPKRSLNPVLDKLTLNNLHKWYNLEISSFFEIGIQSEEQNTKTERLVRFFDKTGEAVDLGCVRNE